jgi:class 3 adenylate cyclase
VKEPTSSLVQAEQRRLAAIMCTDIVGFSRHMGADESRTLRLLALHNQIMQQAVSAHKGESSHLNQSAQRSYTAPQAFSALSV